MQGARIQKTLPGTAGVPPASGKDSGRDARAPGTEVLLPPWPVALIMSGHLRFCRTHRSRQFPVIKTGARPDARPGSRCVGWEVMNHHSSTESSVSTPVSSEAISRRAYELLENEGRPEGSDLRHWLQAEQELTSARSISGAESDTVGAQSSSPSANSDVRPLQGTRAAAAAGRDNKRGSTPPFERNSSGSSNPSSAARRKPTSAPVL